MAQAAGFGSKVFAGFGAGMKIAGAGYEGGQAADYYNTNSVLTMREKERATRAIATQKLEAGIVKKQADAADREAAFALQIGKVKENNFKDESDKTVSSIFSKMAKSGVRMDYGSPMEVIDEAATKRAESLGVLEWTNKHDVYEKQNAADQIRDKATIMLTNAKMAEADLSMYDYQADIYRQAGVEASNASMWKQISAFADAAISVFGDASMFNYLKR